MKPITSRIPDVVLKRVRPARHYVYLIRDSDFGSLLYVGKGFGGRALGLRAWQGAASIDIDIYYAKDEREALRLEHQTIYALKPQWNVVYNRRPVQKADKRSPMPAWLRHELQQGQALVRNDSPRNV